MTHPARTRIRLAEARAGRLDADAAAAVLSAAGHPATRRPSTGPASR
ncbi:MAG TPA: hypothetical protein VFQ68_02400 [Streptosporangiaceae bacterium]|nr:hypothetical protein [Streptosporangiaceae bacterium]